MRQKRVKKEKEARRTIKRTSDEYRGSEQIQ